MPVSGKFFEEDEMAVPPVAASTVDWSQCGYCKKAVDKITRCSLCQFELYCNEECQTRDWEKHKIVCSRKEEVATPIRGLRLIHNFISKTLHDQFLAQLSNGQFRQNVGHFDKMEMKDNSAFDALFELLLEDIFSSFKKLHVFEEVYPLQLRCSILKYLKGGFIEPHIDSRSLSGKVVAVISFQTPVVVNFYSQFTLEKENRQIQVPPCSLYVLSGEARYEWSHSILKTDVPDTRFSMVFTPPGRMKSGNELYTLK